MSTGNPTKHPAASAQQANLASTTFTESPSGSRRSPASSAQNTPTDTKHSSLKRTNLSSKGVPGKRRDNRPTAISLLEELFPVETASSHWQQSRDSRDTVKGKQASEREVPWMRLDNVLTQDDYAQAEGIDRRKQRLANRLSENLALLVLRKASIHLCEADFRRVVPGGQHIEGWNLGGFQKERLHQFNKRHDPAAKHEPIPFPPVLMPDGKRIEEPMARFTLCLPSQELSLQLVHPPFDPALRSIIEQGIITRYARDGSGEAQSEHEVLLDFEGNRPPNSYLVRGAVNKDGDSRKMQWAMVGAQGGIREIKLSQSHQKRQPPKRFVLSFVDESEAQRFCMEWHRRDVSHLLNADGASTDSWHADETLIANAEYICVSASLDIPDCVSFVVVLPGPTLEPPLPSESANELMLPRELTLTPLAAFLISCPASDPPVPVAPWFETLPSVVCPDILLINFDSLDDVGIREHLSLKEFKREKPLVKRTLGRSILPSRSIDHYVRSVPLTFSIRMAWQEQPQP
ncbi:hypothetical protein FH972_022174 [Carpinus fangiana]|uniref:Uncharacterized protein n=1 Tax=Carpinus fangiana TaxID=176857 RepID=A0A5N6KRT9_9ROSI|nr:hypothetical protein FH972_022174 [Carpinus fangiana]